MVSAEREATAAGKPELHGQAGFSACASTAQRGLTPRSRRGPTASHQARRLALFIIQPSGLASCRRSRLNSNVRPRLEPMVHGLITARPSGLASETRPCRAAWHRPAKCTFVSQVQLNLRSYVPHPQLQAVRCGNKRFAGSFFSFAAKTHTLRTHGARKGVLRVYLGGAPCALRIVGGPNPSFEARPNGKPPGPGQWHTVHFYWPGPGVSPSVPPQLKR